MVSNQNSNDARIQQLERRLTAPDSGSKSCTPNFDSLRLNSQQWPTQTQEVSPDAKPVEQDSDDELDGDDFAVISLSDKKWKKRKLNSGESKNLTPVKSGRKASLSASPRPLPKSKVRPPTPLKEQSNAKTPEKGRKKAQQSAQKNTLQKYFLDNLMSPKAPRGDASMPESFAVREAEWNMERNRLMAERDAALKAQKRAADKAEALEMRVNEAKSDARNLQEEVKQGEGSITKLEEMYERQKQRAAVRETQLRNGLLATATQAALDERELKLSRLQAESVRLGSLGLANAGHTGIQEVWEDGEAFKSLARQQQHLTAQREKIEAARKGLRKRLPPPERFTASATNTGAVGTEEQGQAAPSATNSSARIAPDDYVSHDEILKSRLASLKREEDGIHRDRERLEAEKQRHMRELRCMKDEEGSRYHCGMLMSDRYLLQKLLGKGGFSEVHQAFDVDQVREVAVKIHQLNSSWSDAKKASYVKHATREFNIHKSLQHPRIVALVDIFELDNSSFATVLELCPNGDLDIHLKQHQVLPEKEAKAIISQIFQGLAYLNENNRKIIHYDLKPGNILFDCLGQVKITDFGLSKIADESSSQGMDLTSQGAGTYWYLPPETFEIGHQPPKISNKVDVWSAAVILYQMLYGKRPFGEGLTQEMILRGDVMLNARQVTFPSKPSVSQECKDFISKCLAYRPKDRIDVLTAAADPYLVLKRPRPATGSGSPFPESKTRMLHS